MDVRKHLIQSIRNADRAHATRLLEEWGAEHGYERLLTEVVEPVLDQIGRGWSSAQDFSFAQVYVAAKVSEDILTKVAEIRSREGKLTGRRIAVLGNIEEDYHALGRRMVATFLRADGWTVHDLGNDVPPTLFVDKALETGARVIGVSAMMMTTALSIGRVRAELDRRGLSRELRLAVGGAVFQISPGLVHEVGGDGTATNALGVSALFEGLWKETEE